MKPHAAIAALAAAGLAPGAVHAASRPAHRLDLGGGAVALLVEDHALPQVRFGVTLRVGAAADPVGKEGLARLTASMLLRGAGERSRAQIEEGVDSLGSTLDVAAGHTSLSLDGDALSRNLDPFLALLADVLLRPTFPEEELARLKRETVSELQSLRDDDQRLAARFFRQQVFAGHPYGRPALGRVSTVKAITRADVAGFYERHFVAGNIVLSAAGDVTEKELSAALARHFPALPPGKATAAKLPPAPRPKGRRVVLVDKPERTQVQAFLGHEGIAASHPDRHALALANTAFGGTFTARLMQEIRVKHGWSYGAYSRLGVDRDAGNFYLWLFPKTADAPAALRRSLELYEELVARGLKPEELEFAREYRINAFSFATDTSGKHVDELVRVEVLGLPRDWLDTYVTRVREVTADAVQAAVKRHLHPGDLVVTILCTADELVRAVQELPGVTGAPERLPYDSD